MLSFGYITWLGVNSFVILLGSVTIAFSKIDLLLSYLGASWIIGTGFYAAFAASFAIFCVAAALSASILAI